MKHCEAELFKFISQSFASGGAMFQRIQATANAPQIPLTTNDAHQWLRQIRGVFRQCVQCVFWMHEKGVCHLDLSLENTMIFKMDTLWVKIIDFGVAKRFDKHFYNYERVGKIGYMAPEVYAEEVYDARKADIWSLGVMLFMMLVGAPPYKRATLSDAGFNYIINGELMEVLTYWNRLSLISADALDLMERIFKWERERITMAELVCHPFVALGHLLERDEQRLLSGYDDGSGDDVKDQSEKPEVAVSVAPSGAAQFQSAYHRSYSSGVYGDADDDEHVTLNGAITY